MQIEKINSADQNKLFMSIEKLMSSFKRRNISYIINCQSDTIASITIMITGARGTVQKNILLQYNETGDEWIAFTEGYKYYLMYLSELSVVIKSSVTALSATLTKI